MKNSILTLFLLHLAFFGFSQEIAYEIRGMYSRSIVKEQLIDAKTLSDINPGYPSSWIARYYSVELLATCKGIAKKVISKNDILSDEQISLLKMADMGTAIVVNVKYNPKKKDKRDIREINFSYTVIPKIEAQYLGGYDLLKQYLKENAVDKIPSTIAKQLQIATVKFAINEEGQIIDAQISKTSEDKKTDQLLIDAINKMPKWKPAENSNGIKVKQAFEFSVGTFIGC